MPVVTFLPHFNLSRACLVWTSNFSFYKDLGYRPFFKSFKDINVFNLLFMSLNKDNIVFHSIFKELYFTCRLTTSLLVHSQMCTTITTTKLFCFTAFSLLRSKLASFSSKLPSLWSWTLSHNENTLSLWVCLFYKFHVNGISCGLCVWLLPLSIMLPGFIHASACISTPFWWLESTLVHDMLPVPITPLTGICTLPAFWQVRMLLL